VVQRAEVGRTGARVGPRLPTRSLRGLPARVFRPLLAPAYALYTSRLRAQVRAAPAPHHVALILDGNRRWASLAGLRDPAAGHRHGADKLDELLGWCGGLGVAEVTVWALSGENLARDGAELEALLGIVGDKLEGLAALPGIRIRVFGRLGGLPAELTDTVGRVQEQTRENRGLSLNVALGYSGRDELVDATRALIASLAAQGVPADEMASLVDAAALRRHLYTAEHSDPDLIIRTSGEMRLSGFLPWQSSHSEFYFTDVYWPAFRELDFLRAVRTFQQRERRFGR
jgi:short-chain Z-isoprenyl diphosphate synthase